MSELLAADEFPLLLRLSSRPVRGFIVLAEAAAGRQLTGGADVAELRSKVLAITSLIERGLVQSRRVESTVELSLSQAGRKCIGWHRQSLEVVRRWTRVVAMSVAAAGCASHSAAPHLLTKPDLPFPSVTGIGQVVDRDTGRAYFAPCNPCSPPTAKTVSPARAAGGNADQVPVRLSSVPTPLPVVVDPDDQAAGLSGSTPAVTPSAVMSNAPQNASGLTVSFAYASSVLGESDAAKIYAFAAQQDERALFSISGRTDMSGDKVTNQRLAWARATVVKSKLISLGISPSHIRATYCTICSANENAQGNGGGRVALLTLNSVDANFRMRK